MVGTVRIARVTTLALTAALVVGAGTTGTAQGAERPIELTKGHIDLFELTYDDTTDGLRLLVKDGSELYGAGTQFHSPEDVVIAVDEELSALTLPEDLPSSYAFLGDPGDTIYDLPQSQDPDLPWPGWSTERLVASLPEGESLPPTGAVELGVEIDGPGEVFTFMRDAFGEPINRYIDTTDPAPDIIPVDSHAHVHTEWVFTELGRYSLIVTPTATTTDGDTITGPSEEYVFRIGEQPAPDKARSRVAATLKPRTIEVGKRARVAVSVTVPRSDLTARGKVAIRKGRKTLAWARLNREGEVTVRLPRLKRGEHRIRVRYAGTRRIAPSVSRVRTLVVRR